MKLEQLRVNNIEKPLGYAMEPLSFSWRVSEAGKAKAADYARIKVYAGDRQVSDSCECYDADFLDFDLQMELEPRTRYTWTVDVTADNGDSAQAESWFETGKMNEPWRAVWIGPDGDEDIQPVMRKTFRIEGDIADARWYTCGLGLYEVYINGEKTGDEYLAPGYHAYDLHLQVQTLDVTEYLREGDNTIEVWLGNGWYKGRLGFDWGATNIYGDSCCLIGELYNRGEYVTGTGTDWTYRQSPVIEGNIYDGEIYDARLEAALKDDEGWMPAIECRPERCGELGDRYSLPVKKMESFRPVGLIKTSRGEYVLDFGQNMTGWVEFDADLPEDSKVVLTASEIMQDGCFYNENYRTARAEYVYISNGRKAHARPHFTFYGFRYVRVEMPGVPDPENFTAWHLRSDFGQTGWIETGNELVNKLFSNALWSQKDNFLDVPTDCPQRDERLGWTGDAQVFSETACCNMYMPAFYRKYLWDMRAEQELIDGSVPNVVPRIKEGMISAHGMCPWADSAVIIPWNVYMHYGSRTLLSEFYPGMKAWIEYERREAIAAGNESLVTSGMHFGDWLALDNHEPGPFGKTDVMYIASAYYCHCTEILSEAASILGYTDDAEEYSVLVGNIRKAIREQYFDGSGLCTCGTQTGDAIAIAFDLAPAGRIKQGVELGRKIRANEGHLDTGFIGTPWLNQALTMGGQHGTSVDLLLNEEYPGWLHCIRLGATTIWERWNSVMSDGSMNPEGMNSLNHYSYGSIEAWMYKYVCGIIPAEPGFKRCIIEPHPDERLGYAECRMDTASGAYRTYWRYEDNGEIHYEVEVPFGCTAELHVNGEVTELSAGRYNVSYVKGE